MGHQLLLERLEGDDLQECPENEEQYGEGDGGPGAGFGWGVAGEEAVGHSGGHEEEGYLPGHDEEDDTGGQEKGALQAAERVGRLASIEHPDGNEIEEVEPGSGVGESGEDWSLGGDIERHADTGGEETREGAGECDFGAGREGDVEALPAHVGSEAGKEDGEIGFEAEAFDGDDVTELVDEDGESEAGAEPEAVEGPIDAEERGEAEQKFEFEKKKQRSLAFAEQYGDWSERAEAFDPFRLGRRRLVCCVDAGVKGQNALANPFRLPRGSWQPGKCRKPEFAGFGKLVRLFALFKVACGFGDLLDVMAVDQSVALRAGECACWQIGMTVAAVGNYLGGDG